MVFVKPPPHLATQAPGHGGVVERDAAADVFAFEFADHPPCGGAARHCTTAGAGEDEAESQYWGEFSKHSRALLSQQNCVPFEQW